MQSSRVETLPWRHLVSLVALVCLGLVTVSFQLVNLHAAPARPRSVALSLNLLPNDHTELETHKPARSMRQEPPPPPDLPTPTLNPIMKGRRTLVLLVNYLDSKRCAQTLESMFANAVQPELLRVSIHDQIIEAAGDQPCVDGYCQLVGERECRRGQIVSTKVNASEAAGPTVARAITEKALGEEEFCLGIDSHLVFAPRWDEKVVTNWEATENERAILTVYPKSTQFLTDHSKDNKMGVQCNARIETPDKDAMVQYEPVTWFDRTSTTKPRLMSQFAGGFNFGSCQSYRDVPNDPYTPILFYGEEYARAARLWTWGYDLYAPSVDVVYHWYETRPKIWGDNWPKKYLIMQRSKRRVRYMLGLNSSSDDVDLTEIDKYGLGNKRTLEQWIKFSAIDPAAPFTSKTRSQFTNCRELELVPLTS